MLCLYLAPPPCKTSHSKGLDTFCNKKLGFTLAETLITLVIIGVVAALTIPNLMKKYEKHVIETGLKKTYAELSSWIKRAEADFGPFGEWDVFNLSNYNFAQKYAYPYLKLIKCYTETKCYEKGSYWPTTTKEPGKEVGLGDTYIFPDGRKLYLAKGGYTSWQPPGKYLDICVDVNGVKGRSILGQDIFCFHINNFRGPEDRPANTFGLGTDGAGNRCIYEGHYANGKNCGKLLQRNGWKFPDNYPIKF